MQDFGEEGVGSTWLIDRVDEWGARASRAKKFGGARSNFSTDCIRN